MGLLTSQSPAARVWSASGLGTTPGRGCILTTTVTLDERPTWRDVALSFVPSAKRTERAQRLLDRVPLGLILLIQVGLTWRLFDVASDDEALYINAGHDVIQHLLHGGAIANYGTYLSGAPAGYPVVAAGLDSVVASFSCVCSVCFAFSDALSAST